MSGLHKRVFPSGHTVGFSFLTSDSGIAMPPTDTDRAKKALITLSATHLGSSWYFAFISNSKAPAFCQEPAYLEWVHCTKYNIFIVLDQSILLP